MKILHPTDFSDCAARAEAVAVDLARKLDGEIVLFQALVETPLYGEGLLTGDTVAKVYAAQRAWTREKLQARADELRRQGIKASWRVETGVPHQEIVKVAGEESADMIVMGIHGRTGLERMMLGSVAERVVRLASCPVLTVGPKPAGAGR